MSRTHAYDPVASAPPPLHALHVFATAMRTGSFTRAAAALGVTQGAVSRQVKFLEEDLGMPLFFRHKSGLRPTPAADRLFATVDDGLSRIRGVYDGLRRGGQMLTLRVPPTIAVRWFIPMLPSLRSAMPDVDIRVSTDDGRGRRLAEDGVDAAILYGRGDWPDVVALPLLPERLTPVCAPALADTLACADDLLGVPLLQCAPKEAWGQWLEAAGIERRNVHHTQTFDTLELAVSAATRGLGVALGDINLLSEALRDGVLVAPFERVLDRGMSYFLVYPTAHRDSGTIAMLANAMTACVRPASGAASEN